MKTHPVRGFATGLIVPLALLFHVVTAVGADSGDPPAAAPGVAEWRLGNQALTLRFRRSPGGVVAHQLINHRSGRTVNIDEDDFRVTLEGAPPLCSADFRFERAIEEPTASGRRLTFRLAGKASAARLALVYELGDGDGFLRRRLEFEPAGPLEIRDVEVWRAGFAGHAAFQEQCVPVYLQLGPEWRYTAGHRGFGFPVFLEDTFWGLEYPAGDNRHTDGRLVLRHYPGRTVTNSFVSRTAVLGVAEPGQVPVRFREYLDSAIGRRTSPAVFFAWKTWVTLMPPTEANCLAVLGDFQRHLYDPTGARFDSFALDDGWDKKDSLWDIDPNRFPRGFAPLRAALQPLHTGLGLWMSPSTGYDHADWGAAQGYKKNAWTWLLCQSDPNYRRDMVNAVTGLARQHDVNYFKFDGFCAPCDAEGHEHHRPGNYAKEANTDAYLELLAAVRRTQPGGFINLTTGTWTSPWWLQYADSVWDQVYDGWSPAIAPTPETAYSQITDRDAVFRKRCHENPWFPPEALENLGVWTQDYRFIDDQIMTILGRGCRLISFYVDPRQGDDRDWRFLGSAINWARHHQDTLVRTRMILGDAVQLAPYGYAHFLGDRGILVLRNPFITPQTARVRLDETCGWRRADAERRGRTALYAQIVYPYHESLPGRWRYGDELEVKLAAYEMLFVQVTPSEESGPVLLGARHGAPERSDNHLTYLVHGRPGEPVTVSLAGSPRPTEVRWNGSPIPVASSADGPGFSFVMPGRPRGCHIEGQRFSTEAGPQQSRATGQCLAVVPEGTRASMHLLWATPAALCPPPAAFTDTAPGFRSIDDAAEKAALRRQAETLNAARPRCSVTLNGSAVPVKVSDSKLYRPTNVGDHRMYAEYPPAPWVWFQFELPPGRHEVAVSLEWPRTDAASAPQTGWWLWAEHRLESGTLTLSYDGPVPPASAEPIPLARRQEWQREILALQPVAVHPDHQRARR